MTHQPTPSVAGHLLPALEAGRFDAATAMLDESSLLHVPGLSGLAGDYQGREAILGLLRWATELTDGTLRFSDAHLAGETAGEVRIEGRVTARRRARRLDTEVDVVVSIREGEVREIWLSHSDQARVDEFWE